MFEISQHAAQYKQGAAWLSGRWNLIVLVGSALFCVSPSVTAGADLELERGFAIRNHNPFIQIYGVPTFDPGPIAAPGRTKLALTLDITSHFGEGSTPGETLTMDGETYRGEFRVQWGFGQSWEIGLAVPFLAHSGGVLDGFINTWHDTFGLPSIGRDEVPDDQLRFVYQRDGQTRVEITESSSGIGDVLLMAAYAFGHEGAARRRPIVVRSQLKLPTGAADQLRGSGAVDAALSAQTGGRVAARQERVTWFAGAGLTYLGTADVLPDLQRRWIVSATGGLVWRVFAPLALKLQLDGQSSAYRNTGLNELDTTAFQFTIGGSARLSKAWLFDFGVVENFPNGDVSPDISFQLRLRATL